MSTTTLSNVRVSLSATATLALGGITNGTFSGNISHTPAIQSPAIGNAAGNVDKVYTGSVTIATGTPQTLDLTTLTDPAGGTVSFVHVTEIILENLSIVTAEIVTVGGGTNGLVAASPFLLQPNGGVQLIQNPNPGITVDSTHKILTLTAASGAAVVVNVTIIGRSA